MGHVEAVIQALGAIWSNSSKADRDPLILLPVARHFEKVKSTRAFQVLIRDHPDLPLELLEAYHENMKFNDKETGEKRATMDPWKPLVWCGNCQAMIEIVAFCGSCKAPRGAADGVLQPGSDRCHEDL